MSDHTATTPNGFEGVSPLGAPPLLSNPLELKGGCRAIVTGATGFLGGALTRALIARGVSVTALGRNCERGLELERAGAQFTPVDLRDPSAIQRAVRGADVVIHAAALSSAWGKRSEFFSHNVEATENVARATLESGARRMIHISSPSVTSRHAPQVGLDEQAPYPEKFVSIYSESKARAEEVIHAYMDQGLDAVILRPKAIYGPGDQALFPRILKSLRSGRLPIMGGGETLTQITHVDDVVAAILLSIETPEASGQTYLITGDEEVNLWEVIDWIAKHEGLKPPSREISASRALKIGGLLEGVWRLLRLPGEPPLTRYKASVLSYSQLYSIERARRELNYQPQVTWREGLADFLASLKSESSSVEHQSRSARRVASEDRGE